MAPTARRKKSTSSLQVFKNKVKKNTENSENRNSPCRLCKTYIENKGVPSGCVCVCVGGGV